MYEAYHPAAPSAAGPWSHTSVPQLRDAILAYVAAHNDSPKPFRWAAADADAPPCRLRAAQHRRHITGVAHPRHRAGSAIDGAVPDGTRVLVVGVGGIDERAGQLFAQLVHKRVHEHLRNGAILVPSPECVCDRGSAMEEQLFQSTLAREGLGVEAIRLEQLNLVAAGADQAFLAQLAEQAHRDFADASDGIGQGLSTMASGWKRRTRHGVSAC
jgi:hypothetical protein